MAMSQLVVLGCLGTSRKGKGIELVDQKWIRLVANDVARNGWIDALVLPGVLKERTQADVFKVDLALGMEVPPRAPKVGRCRRAIVQLIIGKENPFPRRIIAQSQGAITMRANIATEATRRTHCWLLVSRNQLLCRRWGLGRRLSSP
jgi:hypothetical protein